MLYDYSLNELFLIYVSITIVLGFTLTMIYEIVLDARNTNDPELLNEFKENKHYKNIDEWLAGVAKMLKWITVGWPIMIPLLVILLSVRFIVKRVF